jgi:hypothetical protein
VGANTRLDSLSDLARHRANLRVRCKTYNGVVVIDAGRFNRYCLLRRWNNQLAQLGVRLSCGGCGAPNVHLQATATPAGSDRFPKDEQGWRQLYRRRRD